MSEIETPERGEKIEYVWFPLQTLIEVESTGKRIIAHAKKQAGF